MTPEARAVAADKIGWRLSPLEPDDASLPTLLIIGDSISRNGRGDDSEGGLWGWGEPFFDLFDATKVNVVNRAVGGTSSRTFITLGHWERALTLLKPGDVLLIQFGHNDTSPVNDDRRARATLAGIGDETEAIDNLLTKQHEVVHTFGWYVRSMVNAARARGVTPILVTPTVTNSWTDGRVGRGPGGGRYSDWMHALAAADGIALVDLTTIVGAEYDRRGESAVLALFGKVDHTHTNAEGAALNAPHLVDGLRAVPGDPLAAWVKR